jgi:hypothetical protein
MSEEKKENSLGEKLSELITAENIQKYVLGSTKEGNPRAIYDVGRGFIKPKKKKKKGKKGKYSMVDEYAVFRKKKKGKKKKKNKFPKFIDD